MLEKRMGIVVYIMLCRECVASACTAGEPHVMNVLQVNLHLSCSLTPVTVYARPVHDQETNFGLDLGFSCGNLAHLALV